MPFQRPIPEAKKPGKTTPGLHALVEAEKMTQIAILLPVTALVGWLAGAWLDERLHQGWMGVTGVLLGGVAGLVYVIRLAMTSVKSAEPQDDAPSPKNANERDENRGKME
ncbi:MAG: AtpZ/AtpI family protein [Terriglobales bacterium]